MSASVTGVFTPVSRRTMTTWPAFEVSWAEFDADWDAFEFPLVEFPAWSVFVAVIEDYADAFGFEGLCDFFGFCRDCFSF